MTEKVAIDRLQNICSKQEKCISYARQKLREWKVDEKLWDKILKSLVDSGFINEERFARSFVNDKYKFNKWGKRKIEYQLKAKQIDSSIISIALTYIDDQEYLSIIKNGLEKKLKDIKDKDTYTIKSKLYRFAQSKGYEPDCFLPLINELTD